MRPLLVLLNSCFWYIFGIFQWWVWVSFKGPGPNQLSGHYGGLLQRTVAELVWSWRSDGKCSSGNTPSTVTQSFIFLFFLFALQYNVWTRNFSLKQMKQSNNLLSLWQSLKILSLLREFKKNLYSNWVALEDSEITSFYTEKNLKLLHF